MHTMGGMLKPFVDSLLERNPNIVCITIFCSEFNYILGIVCFILIFFRYFLKVTIVKSLSDIVKEQDILVHTLAHYPELNNSIRMEVGIEDCLHIEFEYNKSK